MPSGSYIVNPESLEQTEDIVKVLEKMQAELGITTEYIRPAAVNMPQGYQISSPTIPSEELAEIYKQRWELYQEGKY